MKYTFILFLFLTLFSSAYAATTVSNITFFTREADGSVTTNKLQAHIGKLEVTFQIDAPVLAATKFKLESKGADSKDFLDVNLDASSVECKLYGGTKDQTTGFYEYEDDDGSVVLVKDGGDNSITYTLTGDIGTCTNSGVKTKSLCMSNSGTWTDFLYQDLTFECTGIQGRLKSKKAANRSWGDAAVLNDPFDFVTDVGGSTETDPITITFEHSASTIETLTVEPANIKDDQAITQLTIGLLSSLCYNQEAFNNAGDRICAAKEGNEIVITADAAIFEPTTTAVSGKNSDGYTITTDIAIGGDCGFESYSVSNNGKTLTFKLEDYAEEDYTGSCIFDSTNSDAENIVLKNNIFKATNHPTVAQVEISVQILADDASLYPKDRGLGRKTYDVDIGPQFETFTVAADPTTESSKPKLTFTIETCSDGANGGCTIEGGVTEALLAGDEIIIESTSSYSFTQAAGTIITINGVCQIQFVCDATDGNKIITGTLSDNTPNTCNIGVGDSINFDIPDTEPFLSNNPISGTTVTFSGKSTKDTTVKDGASYTTTSGSCEIPTNLQYDFTTIDGATENLQVSNFNVDGLTCNRDTTSDFFSVGTATATACGAAGSDYIVAGCQLTCDKPDSTAFPTIVLYDNIPNTDQTAKTFNISALSNAPDGGTICEASVAVGTPVPVGCYGERKYYELTGCQDFCDAPGSIIGYDVTETDLKIATWTVTATCATNYVGTPVVTKCTGTTKAYSLAGCQDDCDAPDLTAYKTVTGSVTVATFAVTAECADDYSTLGGNAPIAAVCGGTNTYYSFSTACYADKTCGADPPHDCPASTHVDRTDYSNIVCPAGSQQGCTDALCCEPRETCQSGSDNEDFTCDNDKFLNTNANALCVGAACTPSDKDTACCIAKDTCDSIHCSASQFHKGTSTLCSDDSCKPNECCGTCGANSANSANDHKTPSCTCTVNHFTSTASPTTTDADCNYCDAAYYAVNNACSACHSSGITTATSNRGVHNVADCGTCATGYHQNTACDKCAADYYDSLSGQTGVQCNQCNTNGGGSTSAGNADTNCGTCSAGYAGNDCGSCKATHYSDGGAVPNAQCLTCNVHGTPDARKSAGGYNDEHTSQDCFNTGSTTACKTGYTAVMGDVSCDSCTMWYYKDAPNGECLVCLQGTEFNAAANNCGGSTSCVNGNGHTYPHCGVCKERFGYAAMDATNNKNCGLCSNDGYMKNGDASHPECDLCQNPGTLGQAGKASISRSTNHGHTQSICDCQTNYFSDASKPRCDYCKKEAYDTNGDGSGCEACHATGSDFTGKTDGHRVTACTCKSESFSMENDQGTVISGTVVGNMAAGARDKYSGAACNTCAKSYYKSGGSAGAPVCSACYSAGTALLNNQDADHTDAAVYNIDGNVLDTCTCKTGYHGTTCTTCKAGYFDNDGIGGESSGRANSGAAATNDNVNLQCAACYALGTNANANNNGNTLTSCSCNPGYFSDASNAKCNQCAQYYYDDVGNPSSPDCISCHNDGTETADKCADAAGFAGNGAAHTTEGACNGKSDCGKTNGETCVWHVGNKNGNTESRCSCKEGYSTTVGTDDGKSCDKCAEDYYDSNGDAADGVQCGPCYAGGTDHGNGKNPEGNAATECNCNAHYTGTTCEKCDTTAYRAGGTTSAPDCQACGAQAYQTGNVPGTSTTCDCDTGYYSQTDSSNNGVVSGNDCNWCDIHYYSNSGTCTKCNEHGTDPDKPVAGANDNTNIQCECAAGRWNSHGNTNNPAGANPCDQCAPHWFSNGKGYTEAGAACFDCITAAGTANRNARLNGGNMEAAATQVCDVCIADSYYTKIADTSQNGGHRCTACPGDTTTIPFTKTTACANSCAQSFALVADADGTSVETCSTRAAGGADKVNYHNKGGSSIDLRDVKGSTLSECCDENECNARDVAYWTDATRNCGTSNPNSKTVSGLGLTTHNVEYCVSPSGETLSGVTSQAACAAVGTWISDGYKTCTIRCRSNGKSDSTPVAAATDFDVESSNLENTCIPKASTSVWVENGCIVDGMITGTTKSSLGTVNSVLGFNQCLVSCPVDNQAFVINAYETCSLDERGNGLTCVPCIYGSTNEAGDAAGPLATSCSIVPVDAFIVDDPEFSVIDFSSKSSECSNISPFKYAKLHTDSTLRCELCGRDSFLESYNANTMDSTITGTRHGVCCQNSHHRVCQKMIEEYKLRCEYEDKIATNAANFIGSWYGKGKVAGDTECGEHS